MKKFLYLCLAGTIVSGGVVLCSQTVSAERSIVKSTFDRVVDAGVTAARGNTDAALRQLQNTAANTTGRAIRATGNQLQQAFSGNGRGGTPTTSTRGSGTPATTSTRGSGTPATTSTRGSGTPATTSTRGSGTPGTASTGQSGASSRRGTSLVDQIDREGSQGLGDPTGGDWAKGGAKDTQYDYLTGESKTASATGTIEGGKFVESDLMGSTTTSARGLGISTTTAQEGRLYVGDRSVDGGGNGFYGEGSKIDFGDVRGTVTEYGVNGGAYDRVSLDNGQQVLVKVNSDTGNFNIVSVEKGGSASTMSLQELSSHFTEASDVQVDVTFPESGGTPITTQQVANLSAGDFKASELAGWNTVETRGMTFERVAGTDNWVQTSGTPVYSTDATKITSFGDMKYDSNGNFLGTEVGLSNGQTVLTQNVSGLEVGDRISIENGTITSLGKNYAGAEWTAGSGDLSTLTVRGDTLVKDMSTGFYQAPDGTMYRLDESGTLTTQSAGGYDINSPTYDAKADFDAGSVYGEGSPEAEAAMNPSDIKNEKQAAEAPGKQQEAEDTVQQAKALDTANTTNAIQYAILIMQAKEANKQEQYTQTVTVEAEKLKKSQGSPEDSNIMSDATLDGSSLSSAARGLALLLQANPVDISLMNTSNFNSDNTSDRILIQNRRNQLLQQYALSAEIIAEGSNVISSNFYDRVAGIAERSGTVTGTLGAMSVLNDTERYPYFEMVRQVVLSGIQLGLKGAETLGHIDIETDDNPGNDDSSDGDVGDPGTGDDDTDNPASGGDSDNADSGDDTSNPGTGDDDARSPASGGDSDNADSGDDARSPGTGGDSDNADSGDDNVEDDESDDDSDNADSGDDNVEGDETVDDADNPVSDDNSDNTDSGDDNAEGDESDDDSSEETPSQPQLVGTRVGNPVTERRSLPIFEQEIN